MLKLWFMTEIQRNNKGEKRTIYAIFKMIIKYSILVYGMFFCFYNLYGMLKESSYIPFFIGINVCVSVLFHSLIQMILFKNLEKDVVISFLPDKRYSYIRVRLIMVILKWTIAFTLPTMFFLGRLIITNSFNFYLVLFMFLIISTIINYLLAIFIRLIFNMNCGFSGGKIKNYLITIVAFVLFYIPLQMSVLQIFFSIGESKNINSNIHLNSYSIILIFIMTALFIILFKVINDIIKVNSSKLILIEKNMDNNVLINVERLLEYFNNNKSVLDKKLIEKDIYTIIRGFGYKHLFYLLMQLIYINLLSYLYFNIGELTNINNVIDNLTILSILIFGATLACGIVGGIILKDELKICKDIELLNQYNIRFNRRNLIKNKSFIAYLMFMGPMYILYCSLLISKFNILGIVQSMALVTTSILLGKSVTFAIVKFINKDYGNNYIIKETGMCMYLITSYICLALFFKIGQPMAALILYAIYNLAIFSVYLYDSKINIDKHEEEKK